jgi:hypothetical protein
MNLPKRSLIFLLCSLPFTAPGGLAGAESQPSPASANVPQSMDDAWWTGPLLANSAATLTPGHFLIEPYLYDVTTAHSNGFGSRAFALYGLAEGLTVGLIPTLGFNRLSGGGGSSGVGVGDITPLAQYRLTQYRQGSWIPATAVMVQETLPTGKYDRLGNRPGDGLGGGAYTTTVALNSQTYFWLPNGRILRMRLDVSQAFSSQVHVEGVSVYGTEAGFLGNTRPGGSFFADLAGEYSLTQRWVLALDATFSHTGDSRVTGTNGLDPNGAQEPSAVRLMSGSSDGLGAAPAIEYSWSSSLGVILGVRLNAAGHNATASVTPAVAINFVH